MRYLVLVVALLGLFVGHAVAQKKSADEDLLCFDVKKDPPAAKVIYAQL
jgi:hypothetical protein